MKTTNRYTILLVILSICSLLSNCKTKKEASFPGYVQGKFTYISAYDTGILKKISVSPGDSVKQGQALFTLEPYPENAELQAANARVQQAIDEQNKHEADYNVLKEEHERNLILFKKDVISKEELEQSMGNFRSAEASRNAAQANLRAEQANQSKAVWISQQKTVTSPIDALVFDTYYSAYEKIEEGKPILALLAADAIKIIFFIPEQHLSTLKLNEEITILLDGAQQPIKAKITYISPKEEYTPPVIFSETERQRLVFRVEARPIASDAYLKIHPGQPVTVRLDTDNSETSGQYGQQ
ncbi:HlyD family secretion protein [Legionella drancourtii]|uniref:RND efflux pump membrane fusion protein barrel-sandwich domain-containing protein n=1 Tax=Legionella drancourtii LLAP12 TaxID=658187 RepID=G9EIW0_9GAMM|nr:HlyD family efflux transporter periplasmic adaptor subunit [Legionella drancourtii]EHL32878.1 hypothetical protein LDG_5116 [Legionella drancourtii LLAP12]